MALEAASLAVVSALHLAGALGGKPEVGAGVPEAIIGIVLAVGAVELLRLPTRGRSVALGAILFAIAGFVLGLTITIRGGEPLDIAYHATVLPILVLTLLQVLRLQSGDEPAWR